MRMTCDYLVLGSGVAGLTFALEASRHGDVLVVTKRSSEDSATAWAQGGIAAVLDPADSFEAHTEDTLTAGRGLSRRPVVERIVSEGPDRIRALMALGAEFTTGDGASHLDLTREGGHSARRVVHAADMTGQEVQRVLVEAVRRNPRIRFLEDHMAVNLVEASRIGGHRQRVVGAYVLDEATSDVHTVIARATVIATGGAGKVYLYTSNPDVATGDGVAMAYRAGATVANMEFFQFHPTCLFHPEAKSFLISEALRGEGGILRLPDPAANAFMQRHHALRDLAPRDVVARAIDFEMKKAGLDFVHLDMSAKPGDWLAERFPNIHQRCLAYGIDMRRQPIPVVPAAHYMCGGVVVDADGRTTLPGLWCIGEASCSGLHGANRLASNSLLEGLVYGYRAAAAVADVPERTEPIPEVPEWDVGRAVPSDEAVVITQNWDEIRRFMWNYVGIVRTDKRLRRAARRIALLQEEIREYYWRHLVTRDLLELRNLATVAEMVVACALARKESRGLHYNLDYPETDDAHFLGDTLVQRGGEARVVLFDHA